MSASYTPSPISSPSTPSSASYKTLPAFISPCPTEHFFSLATPDQHDFNLCAAYFAAPGLCPTCYHSYEVLIEEGYDRLIEEQKALIKEGEEGGERLGKVVAELKREVEELERRRRAEVGRLREEAA